VFYQTIETVVAEKSIPVRAVMAGPSGEQKMTLPFSVHDAAAVDSHIGRRIREERIKRGMSQSELAQRIGITYQQAHKYERGVNRTSASRLLQIASILEVEISELLPSSRVVHTPVPLGRQELELVRNFVRIGSEQRRQLVCQLVRTLAQDTEEV
jgi:transcriptional regulator with XRE-family HTH domain